MIELPDDPTMLENLATPIEGSMTFNTSHIAARIRQNKPLLYIRFSDGQFISMLGSGGKGNRNCDGHYWYHEGMKSEMRKAFHESIRASADTDSIVVEMPRCWSEWSAGREFVSSLESEYRNRMRWWTIWRHAMESGEVFELLDALRDTNRQIVMLGTEKNRSVGDAIGANYLTCPSPAYDFLDQIEEACRTVMRDGCVLLSSIGLATPCLLWRLWTGSETLIDFAHTPDALRGVPIRQYLRPIAGSIGKRFERWKNAVAG